MIRERKRLLLLFILFILLCLPVYSGASDATFKFPTINEDGTALFDIPLGIVFYCGDKSGVIDPLNYTIRVDVGQVDPSLDGKGRVNANKFLPAGYAGVKFWYCAATDYYITMPTYESKYSNEVFFVANGSGVILDVRPGPLGALGFVR